MWVAKLSQVLEDTWLPALPELQEFIFRGNQCSFVLEKNTSLQLFPSSTQQDLIWPKQPLGERQTVSHAATAPKAHLPSLPTAVTAAADTKARTCPQWSLEPAHIGLRLC